MRNIIVCIHQIFDHQALLSINKDALNVFAQDDINRSLTIEPSDLAALEIGLELGMLHKRSVLVVALGPATIREDLIYCLARGAKCGIHFEYPAGENPDTLNASLILSGVLNTLDFDLILCGEVWRDVLDPSFGPYLAELLGLPQITRCEHIEISGDGITATKVCDRGDREIIACNLPALVSVAGIARQPQYVPIKKRQQISDALIKTIPISNTELPEPITQIKVIGPPKPRVKTFQEMDKKLSATERLKILMQGKPTTKESHIIEGPVETSVEKIISFLRENGYLTIWYSS